jgi:hypothetical protein
LSEALLSEEITENCTKGQKNEKNIVSASSERFSASQGPKELKIHNFISFRTTFSLSPSQK